VISYEILGVDLAAGGDHTVRAVRRGVEFVAVLPPWFDGEGCFSYFNGWLIICQPDHPPHLWNEATKQWEPVQADEVMDLPLAPDPT
jgi:hypothetical protein